MQLDITRLADQLMLDLLGESDKLRYRAEGVRLLYQLLVTENEKLVRGQQQEQQADNSDIPS